MLRGQAFSLILLLFAGVVSGQSLLHLQTEPRVQLSGEDFQLWANGVYFTDFTPGRSLSKAGVLGTDLGIPVTYGDRILLLFGDTMAGWSDGGRFYYSPAMSSFDSIGFIPNSDFSRCQYIAGAARQTSGGSSSAKPSAEGCPALQFYLRTSWARDEPAFQPIVINGLEPGDGRGPFRTPSGGIVHNNRLYMFYKVQIQEAQPHLALKTIMVRSDQPIPEWSQSNPPTFSRLYTVSSHPPVPNPSEPPPETQATGKFMFDPPVVMNQDVLKANAITPGLPPPLQTASRVVFVFGSSFRYNRSNLYLAAFDIDNIERGTGSWFYYSGTEKGSTVWTSDERLAAPLLNGDPRIGNHTVMWNQALRRFVLMYGNIVARASATPWGPWTAPVAVFPPNGEWATRLIHRTPTDSIKRTVTPIHLPSNGAQTDLNSSEIGIPYGPNLLEQSTVNPDGSVTLYYTMSTWNPYQVFLTSSTFRLGPRRAPVVSAASFDGTVLAPASIATITGLIPDATVASASGVLPDELGGVNVMVQDSEGMNRKAGLYYVSPQQINFVIPEGTKSGPANINVFAGTRLVLAATAEIANTAPALFSANATGWGPAAATIIGVDPNGKTTAQPSFSCPTAGACVNVPIQTNSNGQVAVELYGTGIRGRQGMVSATLGGVPVPVLFAGPQPEYPGLDQVNLQIPPQLSGRGLVELVLLVDGSPVNTLNLLFQ